MVNPVTNTTVPITSLDINNTTIKLTQGQTLHINITGIKGDQIQFNLGGQTFTANSKVPLSETGQIKVTVLQTQPSLLLGIPPEKTSSQQTQQTIQNTLRQLLPNQIPITQAMQQLTQPSVIQLLPPHIQAQLGSLLESYFKMTANTSAKDIKLQLNNSGLFFEAGIKKNQQPSAQDLKGKLLQINQQINNLVQSNATANKLSAILGQAINKITLQQIQLFENPNLLSLQFPMQQESSIKQIQIDFRKNILTEKPLTEVFLNLNLSEGEITYKLVLDGESLSIYIWTDIPSLEHQISKEMENLRQQLTDSGLPLKNLLLSQNKLQISPQTKQIPLIETFA